MRILWKCPASPNNLVNNAICSECSTQSKQLVLQREPPGKGKHYWKIRHKVEALQSIFDLLPIPRILKAWGRRVAALFTQLLLWSCRWGFGLAERTTDAAPSHWHQLVYCSLCSDLLRAQTVGQPAKWQALRVKIGVMRSRQTWWFKIFHVYVYMVDMCKYSCVCLYVCLQTHMCEHECGDQKLRSLLVLHIMWVACVFGVCVLGGSGVCMYTYMSVKPVKVRSSEWVSSLIDFYFISESGSLVRVCQFYLFHIVSLAQVTPLFALWLLRLQVTAIPAWILCGY